MAQAPEAPSRSRAQIAGRTLRPGSWLQAPRIITALLTVWVAYATVRVCADRWHYLARYRYLTLFHSRASAHHARVRRRLLKPKDLQLGRTGLWL